MRMRLTSMIFVIALTGFILGGCGCFQQQIRGETAPPPAPQATPETRQEMPMQPEPAAVQPTPAQEPMAMLKDINFDFDKYNIRPADAEILKQDMDWFRAFPGKKVRIEGNCDERGTIEYNLALGQRRADSTKSFLVNLGVDQKLLSTISYGKEKPRCTEHNEGCWAINRNTHFTPVE